MKFTPAVSKEDTRLRLRIFSIVVLFVLGLLTVRLAQMQIVDRERYAVEAEGNAVEEKILRPARGYILDRNGILLVDNETTLSVSVSPRRFDEEDIPLLAEIAQIPESSVRRRYQEIVERSTYQTDILLRDVSFDAFARLQEAQFRLPGIGFEESQRRRYHGESRMSHTLGYVREISADRLDEMEEQGYRMGDMVGMAGIEQEYETVLRGRVGRKFVLVNVHGMEVQPYENGLYDVEAESGFELQLSVDSRVQALAESLFVNKRGGAVMMDVNNGEILAMVSAPDYDLNGWRGSLTQEFVDHVMRNEDRPQFVRATQSYQPPGSTWKPFMALVALEEGMIDEESTLFCGGGYLLGGRLYRCHGGAHGSISVKTAIQRSCNTFFFRLMNDTINGKRMDLPTWGSWAHRFGFGTLAPIDFPEQDPGLIPDSAYYNQRYPNGWGPGYTVNLGIGQGNMGTTPLQLARYTAVVANGGTLVTPHLVRQQTNPGTGEVVEPSFRNPRPVNLNPENVAIVQRGMELVVEAGTARRAQIPAIGDYEEIRLGGKTGTAENPRGADHAVFIAYAPAENPEVAVGVLVENAGFGSQTAAPIASLMIEQYLRGEVTRPSLISYVQARSSGRDGGG